MDCVTMETVAMTPEQLNSNTRTPTPTQTNGNDTLSSTLTIRMIMQGKEAGSIIGKKGDNVKKFREDSGAKINISDASCPERIVTVTGTTDQIYKAFTMICNKFEEDIQLTHQSSSLPRPPVTVRLIVPASQCGSLIGKGGSKIKEIREITGASIQVASEMLPNSTERAVTVSGTAEAITKCIFHLCTVMIESPPKGATIPYRPKPALPPVLYAGAQPFAVQGQYIAQHPDPRGAIVQFTTAGPVLTQQQPHQQMAKIGMQPGLLGQPLPMVSNQHMLAGMPPGSVAIAPAAFPRPTLTPQPHQHQHPHAGTPPHHQAHEMTIPNDLIGCIIGRGGSKINEIRQLSGANIKIANVEEGSADRKVTITGAPESINAAQYLINASIEIHKQQLAMDPNANTMGGVSVASPVSMVAAPQGLSPQGLSPPQGMQALAFPAGHAAHMMKPVPLLGLAGHNFGMFPAQKPMTTKLKGAPNMAPNMMPPQAAVANAAAAAAAYKKNIGPKFTPY